MIENYVGTETFRTGVNALAAHATATRHRWISRRPSSGVRQARGHHPAHVRESAGRAAHQGVGVQVRRQSDDHARTFGQERFLLDGSRASGRRPRGAPRAPGLLRRLRQARATSSTRRRSRSNCARVSAWDFVNAGALGATARPIPPRFFGSLSTARNSAHRLNVSLVGDEWALVLGPGRPGFSRSCRGFGREPISGCSMKSPPARLHAHLSHDRRTKAPFETRSFGVFRPQFADMGISGAATDTTTAGPCAP